MTFANPMHSSLGMKTINLLSAILLVSYQGMADSPPDNGQNRSKRTDQSLPPAGLMQRLKSDDKDIVVSGMRLAVRDKVYEARSEIVKLQSHPSVKVRTDAYLAGIILDYSHVEGNRDAQLRVLNRVIETQSADTDQRSAFDWAASQLLREGMDEVLPAAKASLRKSYSDERYVDELMKPDLEIGRLIKANGHTANAYRIALESPTWAVREWGLQKISASGDEKVGLYKDRLRKVRDKFRKLRAERGRQGAKRAIPMVDVKELNYLVRELGLAVVDELELPRELLLEK